MSQVTLKKCIFCNEEIIKQVWQSVTTYNRRKVHKKCQIPWMRKNKKGFYGKYGGFNDKY